ncbi:MFS transporter [Catenulispora subtropica]|uniref:MFS transporter n=1 Tax=Catenulispora subtropica TaxID=450798 RepID=A0ABP5E0T7_9ACTN
MGVADGRRLGRRFGWLWSAYAVSTLGTWLAFNAFNVILIRVLHAGPARVAALAAAGTAVAALVAVPLGPWIEVRRKRPVMVAMDLVRCAALLTLPVASAFGVLGFAQLLAVSIVVGACDIAFGAASGAYVKTIVAREDLMVANGRFEATTWSSIVVGPPLGGAAVAMFGPVATVVADAVSFLLSALGIRAIGGREADGGARAEAKAETHEETAARSAAEARAERPARMGSADLSAGWRHILGDSTLRPLFLNTVAVNALIMATEPLLAVLMLGRLGFPAWQYGMAFAVPCVGGLIGSRLSARLVARFGRHRVLTVAGTLRALPPIGLVFLGPGLPGLLVVMGVETALITSAAVFNPVLATQRLDQTGPGLVARVLTAWSISTKLGIAAGTAAWGLLAAATSPRFGLGLAGAFLLATPLLLARPRRSPVPIVDRSAPGRVVDL